MFIVPSLICFPTTARSLLDDLPHGILDAGYGILNLAGGPLGLAVRLQLGIAHHLAHDFLDRAFDLFRDSRDPILVHDQLLLLYGADCLSDAGRPFRRDSRSRHTGMPVHWGAWLRSPGIRARYHSRGGRCHTYRDRSHTDGDHRPRRVEPRSEERRGGK